MGPVRGRNGIIVVTITIAIIIVADVYCYLS